MEGNTAHHNNGCPTKIKKKGRAWEGGERRGVEDMVESNDNIECPEQNQLYVTTQRQAQYRPSSVVVTAEIKVKAHDCLLPGRGRSESYERSVQR